MRLVDVDTDGFATLIATLREEGGDTTTVEAKAAAGGFPTDLARTTSAFGKREPGSEGPTTAALEIAGSSPSKSLAQAPRNRRFTLG